MLMVLLILFIAIQFVQPDLNISGQVLTTDISKLINIPAKVYDIFKNSCNDCHSNNTRYPWYMNVQPMGWMMAKHIREGKENLNFSEFGRYSKRKKANKLRAIATSIKDGSMPIQGYTIMHPDAKLNEDEIKIIMDWATKTRDSLLKIE